MAEDKMKEIMDKLEKGIIDVLESDKYKNYLKFLSNFHSYSANNSMLIFLQKPDASLVAGYKSWQKLGRQVQKGEKGIDILAPMPFKYEKNVDKINKTTKEITKEVKLIEGLRFGKVSVFDVSQTQGKDLPLVRSIELNGSSTNSQNVINAIKNTSEIPITFESIENGAKGYYSPLEDRIVIKEGMSLDQTAKTLIHEYTHSKLHSKNSGSLDRNTQEVQAESVAFVVSDKFGIDTSDYSFNYLASWSSGKELTELKNSLEIIQKTSHEIIEKIETLLTKELELQNSPAKELPLKDKIIELYKTEFPSIKHISESTAQLIDTLNQKEDKCLTVKEIKKIYKQSGKDLENSNSPENKANFNTLGNIVDDFKQAQLLERKSIAHDKAIQNQLNKSIELDII